MRHPCNYFLVPALGRQQDLVPPSWILGGNWASILFESYLCNYFLVPALGQQQENNYRGDADAAFSRLGAHIGELWSSKVS